MTGTSAAVSWDYDAHARRMLAVHFDPEGGSPYWLQRERELQIDVRREVQTTGDLRLLGPMDEDVLRRRPLLDFVPRSRRSSLAGAVITETGGTTGTPKRTVFSQDEFQRAFVEPFVRAAEWAGFPRGLPWLWLGPSGPHVIARAAAGCAAALASPQPFSVDFDPRWYRKLPADSFARQRYLEHLLDQARQIFALEDIGVLFTTPAMLPRLAADLNEQQRLRIRGVHYGGMRVPAETLQAAQTEWFPNAVHLAGYGNSLFGVCMEFGGKPDRVLRYFPYGPRHLVRIAEDGRVWMSRLDESVLLLNLPERDAGEAAEPPPNAPGGFGHGVQDPRPRNVDDGITGGIY